jgi:leucyl-tRNA synthetase
MVNIVFQVNGKVRDIQKLSVDISEEDLRKRALENEKVQKHIQGKEIRKIIFVKGRLINIVV